MLKIVKTITEILVKDKKLYKGCGDVFTYLNELKSNYSNTKYHNIAWQFSQVIEIVYSNKLIGIDIDLFDAIIHFSIRKKDNKHTNLRYLILANFDTTIYVSNIRKKDNENIEFKIFEWIINCLNSYPCYFDKNNKQIKEIYSTNNYDEKVIFTKLINSKFSNNALYFLGLFLYIYKKTFSQNLVYEISKSISINLYLTQAKFLFAPTLCISYPFYNNYDEIERLCNEIDSDQNKIKDFTKIILDVVKQAAIINRALVMETNRVYSKLDDMFKKYDTLWKIMDENNQYNIMNTLCFDEKLFSRLLGIKSKETTKDIINDLLKSKKIINISKEKNLKVYMFTDFYKSIKKIIENDEMLPTSQIFILKEKKS